jgi:segregation and condensation protein B
MSNDAVLPEIKEILGAMIFGSNRPLDIKEMRDCLAEVAKTVGGETAAFSGVKEADVREALERLREDLNQRKCGFTLAEVAGGFRFQSSASCGKWLHHLLNTERPNRLSQPALETLAIVAYRQPVSKPEIEGVRGVNVDHIIKSLLEMQLIRIAGRSDLPGRPFLYATTHSFLEHFGLKDIGDLRQMEPLLLRERERKRIEQKLAATEPPAAAAAPLGEGGGQAGLVKEAPAGKDVAPVEDAKAPEEGETEGKEEAVDEDEFDEDDESEDDEDEEDEDEDEEGDEDEDKDA